jgi:hypothetical protein
MCSGVNSVEIALCDGHIADWPIAHTVVTKKACGIVFTRLNEQKPTELTNSEVISTGFGPHLSIKFPTKGDMARDEKAP